MLSKLKKWFMAGLLVLIPILVSIYSLVFLFNFLDGILQPILKPILGAYLLPGFSMTIMLLLILGVGALVSNAVGNQVFGYVENVLMQVPIVRAVYDSVKQACSTFLMADTEFKSVVLIEYPRRGSYVPAFVTSPATEEIQQKTSDDVVNVFVPTSPNPTSGFLLLLPKDEIIKLDMSVEDGLKLIVSGGFFTPRNSTSKEPKADDSEASEGDHGTRDENPT